MARTGGSARSKARKPGVEGVTKLRVSAKKKLESLRHAKVRAQADRPNVKARAVLSTLLPDPNLEAPADELLTNYARSLLLRLSEATRVPRHAVEGDEWKPRPNACHRNAKEWVEMNRKWTVVHGWLVADCLSSDGYVDLLPHSIVRLPSGELLDITPPPPEAPAALGIFPFLSHIGEAKEFLHYVENYPVAHLRIRGPAATVSFFRE